MAENNNENKDKILEAMWRGDLSVRKEEADAEPAGNEVSAEPAPVAEQKEHRRKAALEHLFSGMAFKERED